MEMETVEVFCFYLQLNFSHTTGSHAKPPMQQPDLYYINSTNQWHYSTKKRAATAEIKPRYLQKTQKPCRAGGRGRSGNGGRQQKQLNPETPCDLKTPHTLEPILPAVCEKYVFRFIRSSASGKPHFSHTTGSHAKPPMQQHNAKSAELKTPFLEVQCL